MITSLVRVKDANDSWVDIPVILGPSAYQLAVVNGFKGTEQEWLESLKGSSVSIISIEESTEEEGVSIITFSDGNTLSIKNGKSSGPVDTYSRDEIDAIMGSYITDVASLLGGGFQ